MEPITNSVVKEKIRLQFENEAKNKELIIKTRVNENISKIRILSKPEPKYFLIIGFALGVFSAFFYGLGMVIRGPILGGIVWLIIYLFIGILNKKSMDKRLKMRQNAEEEIRKIYLECEQKTKDAIEKYEQDVKEYCKKALQSKSIDSMTDRTVLVIEKMISHADSRPHIKIVEANLNYIVTKDKIEYLYNSEHTNVHEDFNFEIERFRNLQSDAECEGLAQALLRLSIPRIKAKYGKGARLSLVSHNDANVIVHFSMPNINYQTGKDVF